MQNRPVQLFLFAFLLCSVATRAQVRLFGGSQITSANYSIRNAVQPTESKIGFLGGIGLTNQVEGPLYFSPSLYYSRKGYKVSFNRPANPPDSAALNNNTSINTISFTPQLQWNFSDNPRHFFVRLGPALDVAINGREVFDSSGGKPVDRSMLFSSVGYSPVTASANVQVGFAQKKGLGFFAFYEHGLSSLNNKDMGPIILHRIGGVAIEYHF